MRRTALYEEETAEILPTNGKRQRQRCLSDCRQRSDFSKGKSGLCCISVIFFSNGMKILTLYSELLINQIIKLDYGKLSF